MEIRKKSKHQKQASNVCKGECRKGSTDDFHAILKAKSREGKEKSDNCQALITWHSTS